MSDERWEPVVPGVNGYVAHESKYGVTAYEWSLEGDLLVQENYASGKTVSVRLPPDIRLCRAVPTPPAAAPEPEPEPDWSTAPESARWRTVDADGRIAYWRNKPQISDCGDHWIPTEGEFWEGPRIAPPWTATLRRRPGGER